jgi:hypothetical protein
LEPELARQKLEIRMLSYNPFQVEGRLERLERLERSERLERPVHAQEIENTLGQWL